MEISSQRVLLNTFFDALDAGRACEFLEAEEIEFTIEDYSVRQQGVHKFLESRPPILMEIYVDATDVKSARDCLRRTMHLFPEREIELAVESMDEEQVLSEALVCDSSEDAVAVSGFLREAGVWSTVRQDVDGDNDKIYIVEVKADKIEQAIESVNRWLSSTEMR